MGLIHSSAHRSYLSYIPPLLERGVGKRPYTPPPPNNNNKSSQQELFIFTSLRSIHPPPPQLSFIILYYRSQATPKPIGVHLSNLRDASGWLVQGIGIGPILCYAHWRKIQTIYSSCATTSPNVGRQHHQEQPHLHETTTTTPWNWNWSNRLFGEIDSPRLPIITMADTTATISRIEYWPSHSLGSPYSSFFTLCHPMGQIAATWAYHHQPLP